jgi:hypothetical protein
MMGKGGDSLAKIKSVSVPDSLAEKMDKWKKQINYSKLFQEVVEMEIVHKEGLEKQIVGDDEMKAIIQRLHNENKQLAGRRSKMGENDGVAWAKTAKLEEILYVVNDFTPFSLQNIDDPSPYNPKEDKVLGSFFRSKMESVREFKMDYDHEGNRVPNDAFLEWEQGFHKGVDWFWSQIKDKI